MMNAQLPISSNNNDTPQDSTVRTAAPFYLSQKRIGGQPPKKNVSQFDKLPNKKYKCTTDRAKSYSPKTKEAALQQQKRGTPCCNETEMRMDQLFSSSLPSSCSTLNTNKDSCMEDSPFDEDEADWASSIESATSLYTSLMEQRNRNKQA